MTLAVQLTFALVVVELQLGVVDVTARQQTHGQVEGGRVLGADRRVAWGPEM